MSVWPARRRAPGRRGPCRFPFANSALCVPWTLIIVRRGNGSLTVNKYVYDCAPTRRAHLQPHSIYSQRESLPNDSICGRLPSALSVSPPPGGPTAQSEAAAGRETGLRPARAAFPGPRSAGPEATCCCLDVSLGDRTDTCPSAPRWRRGPAQPDALGGGSRRTEQPLSPQCGLPSRAGTARAWT